MKPSTSEVDQRAPLSKYLRAEDEDGWTVFSSDEEQVGVELVAKPERSPDLSVLKRIKNFLSDEGAQEGSFLSNDEGDVSQNFRVDYPFYDSYAEEDALVETSRSETNASAQDSANKQFCDVASEAPSIINDALIEPTNDEKSTLPQADKTNASVLEIEPVVLQAPPSQPFCASSEVSSQRSTEEGTNEETQLLETPEISNDSQDQKRESETQDVDSADAENAVEELEELETASYESVSEESVQDSLTEVAVESAPSAAVDVQTLASEETVTPQRFVVDFSETLSSVLERRAQGEEIEEPSLVQTRVKRGDSPKKEAVEVATSSREGSRAVPIETPKKRDEELGFRGLRRESEERMAIFRRCVDLVSQRANVEDVPTANSVESTRLGSTFKSCAPSFLDPQDDAFDYGESITFVAAPCFCDLGTVASFETTATLGVLSR